MVLRRRVEDGREIEELIVNGVFAMDSVETHSERSLGELALWNGAAPRPRVLVGGLGLGYTVGALIERARELAAGDDGLRIDVVEIEECLIGWAEAGLTPTLAAVAADPRVRLHHDDVRLVLTGARSSLAGPWDAIVLDVDNGPDFLIHAGNEALYGEQTLRAAYQRLAPEGILAIWCQGAAPDLLRTLQRISAATQERAYRVRRGEREFGYTIYTVLHH